jgi:hypothetical protein
LLSLENLSARHYQGEAQEKEAKSEADFAQPAKDTVGNHFVLQV